MVLTRKNVDGIQLTGGTILGTSRGGADIKCALSRHVRTVSEFRFADRCHGQQRQQLVVR